MCSHTYVYPPLIYVLPLWAVSALVRRRRQNAATCVGNVAAIALAISCGLLYDAMPDCYTMLLCLTFVIVTLGLITGGC